jgi:prevent-host-death family protein
MVKIINIYEAKTHLSKLVDQAASGQDVILARHGKPVALITAIGPAKPRIQAGLLKGKLDIPDDFNLDAPLPDELLRAFRGEES